MDRRKFIKNSLGLLGACAFPSTAFGSSDFYIDDKSLFDSTFSKLKAVQSHIGFGYFNIISFDEVLKIARNSKIGAFNTAQINFMDFMFSEDPKKYGFYGRKTCDRLTSAINKKDIVKIPRTGNYLFKGLPYDVYTRLVKDVGDTLFLTSGVRSVPKQMYLYMNKIKNSSYNISKASFSLAPPAHSYHSIGDFDVGKHGFGALNFTEEFIKTDEFKKLIELEYVSIRYTKKNLDGVRFEPWHVQIN
ncbi:M15 family metallopeptidase [Campylobacter fetus]|uniref:M15 family metallopeptidase n=1 Tax=Campylobacter fetus TaxID=196 RepID=UPI003AF474A5